MSRRTLLVVTLACVCVTQISVTRVYTQGRGQALVLPEGAGKETVQSQCSKCHALNLIGNAGGYTRQGWADLFGTMVVLGDLEKGQVADYLAKNFPEQPRPSPVVIPGPVNIAIKE